MDHKRRINATPEEVERAIKGIREGGDYWYEGMIAVRMANIRDAVPDVIASLLRKQAGLFDRYGFRYDDVPTILDTLAEIGDSSIIPELNQIMESQRFKDYHSKEYIRFLMRFGHIDLARERFARV